MREQAMAALQACQAIGMPECRINLAHVVTYLSEAPKSTRAFEAYNRARELAKQDMTLPVPVSIRNAPTRMMKQLGYGEGYKHQPHFAYGFCTRMVITATADGNFLGIQLRTTIYRHKSVGKLFCSKKATWRGRSGTRTR
jgi:replication-associated recombination protein RarA